MQPQEVWVACADDLNVSRSETKTVMEPEDRRLSCVPVHEGMQLTEVNWYIRRPPVSSSARRPYPSESHHPSGSSAGEACGRLAGNQKKSQSNKESLSFIGLAPLMTASLALR